MNTATEQILAALKNWVFEGVGTDSAVIADLLARVSHIEETYQEKNPNVLIEDDGVYQIKDNQVYPVAHPDLSTQPSIMPQRFGNLKIKEVLIRNGYENEIPSNATVISAWSFNKTACYAAVSKIGTKTITVQEEITEEYNPYTCTPSGFSLPIGLADLDSHTQKAFILNKVVGLDDVYNYLRFYTSDNTEIVPTYKSSDSVYFSISSTYSSSFTISMYGSYPSQTVLLVSSVIVGPTPFTIANCVYDDGTRETRTIVVEKEKTVKCWEFSNHEGIEPDYTLVQYIDEAGGDDPYYSPYTILK